MRRFPRSHHYRNGRARDRVPDRRLPKGQGGLYEHANYGGAALILTAGAYANIHLLFNFGDVVSSVRINPAQSAAGTISPIPLVVELYEHASFNGNRLVIVENAVNIPSSFGSEFNDVTTAVRVKAGPNFTAGKKAELFRDVNFAGGSIQLAPGDYPNIGASHGFNDVVSSVCFPAFCGHCVSRMIPRRE
jgi:hypothetical protein